MGIGSTFHRESRQRTQNCHWKIDVARSHRAFHGLYWHLFVWSSLTMLLCGPLQRRVLNANDRKIQFEILSNPEFLAEGPYTPPSRPRQRQVQCLPFFMRRYCHWWFDQARSCSHWWHGLSLSCSDVRCSLILCGTDNGGGQGRYQSACVGLQTLGTPHAIRCAVFGMFIALVIRFQRLALSQPIFGQPNCPR